MWYTRILTWPGMCFFYLVHAGLTLIASFALYYSNPALRNLNLILVVLFILCSIRVFLGPLHRYFLGLWLISQCAIGTYYGLTTHPSNDRHWRADMASPARAIIDGDIIHIQNYRNFDYRSVQDFTPRYETRTVQLSHLTSVDFYISYWMPGPIAHTFVSFNFSNAPPIAISIEARYEYNEQYAPIASLFRQFEIIYIVGDERDIVKVRTNFRHETVYRYRIQAPPENVQRLFMEYLHRINELADYPEFYNLLKNNCTINIIRYANRSGRNGSFDIRHLINGYSDRYLYRTGLIDNSRPFEEMRANARINEAAQAAEHAPDFSERIRLQSIP